MAVVALLGAAVGAAGLAGVAGAVSLPASRKALKLSDSAKMIGHPVAGRIAHVALSSTVPAGDVLTGYAISFGDGTRPVRGKRLPKTAAHLYGRAGRYTIAVLVTDRRHRRARATSTVIVGRPPAAIGGASAGTLAVQSTAPGSIPPTSASGSASSSQSPPTSPSSATASPVPGPLTAGPLTTALTKAGASVSGYLTSGDLQYLRITVNAPVAPPAWPVVGQRSNVAKAAVATSPASGWLVWPLSQPLSGLVVYGHGCCGVPADLSAEAAAVATASHALVIAMDYRAASFYEPDIASEDCAAATAVVEAAVPSVGPTVAYGVSEGGETTGLMIEHHPGLVESWVDQSGVMDLGATTDALSAELDQPASQDFDPVLAQSLLDLVYGAAGPGGDPVALANLSPALHEGSLSGLQQAVVIHATGDEIVAYANATEIIDGLTTEGVPSHLYQLVPAAGQPQLSMRYHLTGLARSDALAAVTSLLTMPASGNTALTTVQQVDPA